MKKSNFKKIKQILDYSSLQLMSHQQLRQENKKLKEMRSSCEQELQKLKEVGRTHQNQIDTLLKFNERLLGIIQNQFNSATKNKISSELQIIAETNQAPADLASTTKLKNMLTTSPPPRIGGGLAFEQQDLQGFEDEQEQQIYNQQTQKYKQAAPQNTANPLQNINSNGVKGTTGTPGVNGMKNGTVITNKELQSSRPVRLDKVYQLQNKNEQVSINLSSSLKNSNPASSAQNRNDRLHENDQPSAEQLEIQQLKEMVKEYQQQFVENSAQYQQICQIIHNDLVNDLNQFRKLEQQSQQFFQQRMEEVKNLRNDISNFRPVAQLARVMKQLNVPAATKRLLQQRIINRQS